MPVVEWFLRLYCGVWLRRVWLSRVGAAVIDQSGGLLTREQGERVKLQVPPVSSGPG
jgi:hypothetical protein